MNSNIINSSEIGGIPKGLYCPPSTTEQAIVIGGSKFSNCAKVDVVNGGNTLQSIPFDIFIPVGEWERQNIVLTGNMQYPELINLSNIESIDGGIKFLCILPCYGCSKNLNTIDRQFILWGYENDVNNSTMRSMGQILILSSSFVPGESIQQIYLQNTQQESIKLTILAGA